VVAREGIGSLLFSLPLAVKIKERSQNEQNSHEK
jgi:hypothetical protein